LTKDVISDIINTTNTKGEPPMDKRNTKQLEAVRSYVSSVRCHPTAEQVYRAVAEISPGIGLRTVYRNLEKLAEQGDIRRIMVPNQPDRFDATMLPHQHVSCICCGAFDDVFLGDEEVLASVDGLTDYEIDGCDIVFRGLCPSCKNK